MAHGWLAGFAAILAVGLAGCATGLDLAGGEAGTATAAAAPPPAARPAGAPAARPLGAEEVRVLLAGNSVYASSAEVRFAALHEPGGGLRGKAWSEGTEDAGRGEWRIEADGRYCRKWDNGWAGGEWGCFRLFRNGNALTMQNVSGAGADGQMVLVPGNAYDL